MNIAWTWTPTTNVKKNVVKYKLFSRCIFSQSTDGIERDTPTLRWSVYRLPNWRPSIAIPVIIIKFYKKKKTNFLSVTNRSNDIVSSFSVHVEKFQVTKFYYCTTNFTWTFYWFVLKTFLFFILRLHNFTSYI